MNQERVPNVNGCDRLCCARADLRGSPRSQPNPPQAGRGLSRASLARAVTGERFASLVVVAVRMSHGRGACGAGAPDGAPQATSGQGGVYTPWPGTGATVQGSSCRLRMASTPAAIVTGHAEGRGGSWGSRASAL